MPVMNRGSVIGVEEKLDATCLSCGYALRGLASTRCPECGRDFDWDNPWTMHLPRRPAALLRWLGQSPGAVTRALPWIALALAAYGTRVPGWASLALQAGVLVAAGCAVGWACMSLARRALRRRGYHHDEERFAAARGRMAIALVAVVLVVALRPVMVVGFWISRQAMQRVADEVMGQNFATAGKRDVGRCGLYYAQGVRRCPHGVRIGVNTWDSDDANMLHLGVSGGGFFYKPEPGECDKFEVGLPLGGGWYVSND
jgi:hypothetical protein